METKQQRTADLILAGARASFAADGYGATSLSAVARAAGTSKQVVLHHFRSKERLYLTVLASVQDELTSWIEAVDAVGNDPTDQLWRLIGRLLEAENQQMVLLTLRALLEVEASSPVTSNWPLKPFVERLRAFAAAASSGERAAEARAFAMVYGLLGSVSYYLISRETLIGMYGADAHLEMEDCFKQEVRSRLENLKR
ncbi:MAG: helix-turn-helix domain-containing protein [Halieaceae bacterium]